MQSSSLENSPKVDSDEAAFVDSFFLPGGILDPEDVDGSGNEGPTARPNAREEDRTHSGVLYNLSSIPTVTTYSPWGGGLDGLVVPPSPLTTNASSDPLSLQPPALRSSPSLISDGGGGTSGLTAESSAFLPSSPPQSWLTPRDGSTSLSTADPLQHHSASILIPSLPRSQGQIMAPPGFEPSLGERQSSWGIEQARENPVSNVGFFEETMPDKKVSAQMQAHNISRAKTGKVANKKQNQRNQDRRKKRGSSVESGDSSLVESKTSENGAPLNTLEKSEASKPPQKEKKQQRLKDETKKNTDRIMEGKSAIKKDPMDGWQIKRPTKSSPFTKKETKAGQKTDTDTPKQTDTNAKDTAKSPYLMVANDDVPEKEQSLPKVETKTIVPDSCRPPGRSERQQAKEEDDLFIVVDRSSAKKSSENYDRTNKISKGLSPKPLLAMNRISKVDTEIYGKDTKGNNEKSWDQSSMVQSDKPILDDEQKTIESDRAKGDLAGVSVGSPGRVKTKKRIDSEGKKKGAETPAGKSNAAITHINTQNVREKEETGGTLDNAEKRQTGLMSFILFIKASIVGALRWVVECYTLGLVPFVQQTISSVVLVVSLFVKSWLILLLAVANIFKFAADESTSHSLWGIFWGSPSVLCYYVFCLMPILSNGLMAHVGNLPHFTPHLMSNVAVYYVCRLLSQVSADSSSLRRKGAKRSLSSSINSNSGSSYLSGLNQQQNADRFANEVCQMILKIIRMALPICFFLEGFSSTNSSFMLLEAPARMVLAYLLSLVKSGLILSPVAWVGWSVQILLSNYLPAGAILNLLLFFLGLAFIRLVSLIQLEGPPSFRV